MLFIISGPSGVGKGTIINQILIDNPTLGLGISATTRAPRSGEIPGESYHFLSESEFNHHIDSNNFLEWCTVHNNKYGTLSTEVSEKLTQFDGLIIEIDVQGAQKLKQHPFPQHHIFCPTGY